MSVEEILLQCSVSPTSYESVLRTARAQSDDKPPPPPLSWFSPTLSVGYSLPSRALVTVTPPQTNSVNAPPAADMLTSGAHCLVVDISGSMQSAATVTNDDGDKVSHGWSQLDIAKHASCTYVEALGDGDYVCIVVYASTARVHLAWMECRPDNKATIHGAIKQLKTEGATNLRDAVMLGVGCFERLPPVVLSNISKYALCLALCTDGLPSATYSPPGGYRPYVDGLLQSVSAFGTRPILTSIGIGNSLDSALLSSFSDVFLHIPDPGSVGPFIVNLLANTQAMAKVATQKGGTRAAARTTVAVRPASAVRGVPGYAASVVDETLRVCLGSLNYDQPRHLVIMAHGDSASLLTVALEVDDDIVVEEQAAFEDASAAFEECVRRELDRTAAVCSLQFYNGSMEGAPLSNNWTAGESRLMEMLVERLQPGPLKDTLSDQGLMALQVGQRTTWGRHYLLTLPQMLRIERRSNFRDLCLASFGKDKAGEFALFEQLSNNIELIFASFPPPEPSLTSSSSSGPRPPSYSVLPDEFMRGGGCFGPRTVVCVKRWRDMRPTNVFVWQVEAGDLVQVAGGSFARVLCVVVRKTSGQRFELTKMAEHLDITGWHPIFLRGKWHFPSVCGPSRTVFSSEVYNFVLETNHVLLVDNIPAVTLGHCIDAPIVGHPFWGTSAVVACLSKMEGWAAGRVVVEATMGAAA